MHTQAHGTFEDHILAASNWFIHGKEANDTDIRLGRNRMEAVAPRNTEMSFLGRQTSRSHPQPATFAAQANPHTVRSIMGGLTSHQDRLNLS